MSAVTHAEPGSHSSQASTWALALGAIGVVFGDIGTSPLYAVKECFHGPHAIETTPENIYGVLSLIFWSLTVVVSIKYIVFIMRADNRGEGGIFALLSMLLVPGVQLSPRLKGFTIFLSLFGAALLYGDGIITPSISILSAMEGLKVATTAAEPAILPLTCMVLALLFSIQRYGTDGIGRVFGPVMILWFITISIFGVLQLLTNPEVLQALNPLHAIRFFWRNGLHGFIVLGSVVLCITGGEALYADMGHFGRRPITLAWTYLVFPALLLNYFGQGALLLAHPETAVNPFYGLVPRMLLYPMVALSTTAAFIASQALISGAFSLTRQAVQMGYCPRVKIIHTSKDTQGQIYIPGVNWAMMILCFALVLAFGDSSRMAAAYGIAVTATMCITSVIFYLVITRRWNIPAWKAIPLLVLFLLFDLVYFGSNLLKFFDGGWFPMAIAGLILIAMSTWKAGRAELARKIAADSLPLELFLKDVAKMKPHRVSGTAIFMFSSPGVTPPALLHHIKHNQVLHEQVVILSILADEVPLVRGVDRVTVEELGHGFFRAVARTGFMETPNVPEIMRQAHLQDLVTDPAKTSFFLGRESLLTTGRSKMMGWRKGLFAFISRNARPATDYFGIPPGRVVELGMQIQL